MSRQPIFSDDPEVIDKLEARIVALEGRQKLMVAANKVVRLNDPEALRQFFMGQGMPKLALRAEQFLQPDFMGRKGFPDYEIKNNSGNIRRLKERLRLIKLTIARITAEV